jgi:hypothetical protein
MRSRQMRIVTCARQHFAKTIWVASPIKMLQKVLALLHNKLYTYQSHTGRRAGFLSDLLQVPEQCGKKSRHCWFDTWGTKMKSLLSYCKHIRQYGGKWLKD